MKTLSKLAVVAAAATAAVAVVRRYDLVNKGAALVEQGVVKAAAGAEWAIAKATELGERFLNQFVDEEDLAWDPTEDPDPAAAGEAAYGRRADGSSVGFGEVR